MNEPFQQESISPELPVYTGPHPPVVCRPHLGWAAIFIGIYLFLQVLVGAIIAVKFGSAGLAHLKKDPSATAALLIASIASALLCMLLSWPLLSACWRRPFWSILQLNFDRIKDDIPKLIGLGFGVSIIAQVLEHLMTLPKDMPIDAFFNSHAIIWWLTLYGVIIAPLFEETLFRGFLLPAFAIAIDWMLPANEHRPLNEDGYSRPALIVSALLTSAAFGSMHAAQLNFAWNAVVLLSCVGLTLAWVRLHYRSLAASVIVHSAYNGSLFLLMFIATGGYRHLDKLTQR